MLRTPEVPDRAAILAARERLSGVALRTPLVPLACEGLAEPVYLKLELLQPIGSFKLRGATNALALADPSALAAGVVTPSAGNMGQGVAWAARARGIPCRVVVPDTAPRTKLAALERLGAETVAVPFERWWEAIESGSFPGLEGVFVHPVCDSRVIAGHATIGLELLEDLPDVGTVLVPYGGGGLSAGIAAALRAAGSDARVLACEVETAAPLSASLAAGEPRSVERRPSFVDGIGGNAVLPAMWPLARDLLAGAVVVTLAEVAAAVRLLALRAHVIAEGAGAASVAAALTGRAGAGPLACVVSGGNLDPGDLVTILSGGVPG